MDLVRYFSGLILAGSLLFLVLWLLKRSRFGAMLPSSPIQFVHQVGVGPREKLVIIRYQGNEYLLGVTAHSITRLETTPQNQVQSMAEDQSKHSQG